MLAASSVQCFPPPLHPGICWGLRQLRGQIILLPSPSRGGRRGGPRGHVKAVLPHCPGCPPTLSPHVCHSSPQAGRARSERAVLCPGHVTPAQAGGHGCPKNRAGRDPGDRRGCPLARGWGAENDPVSASSPLPVPKWAVPLPRPSPPPWASVQLMWHDRIPIPFPCFQLCIPKGPALPGTSWQQLFHSSEG